MDRKTQISQMKAEGKSQRYIADALHISKSTVQYYWKKLDEETTALAIPEEKPRAPGVVKLAPSPLNRPTATGGALTSGQYVSTIYAGGIKGILPPPDHESSWRSLNFEQQTFDRMSPGGLIELLATSSPDISRAVWDTVQMVDPGHGIKCWDINGDRTKINKRAQRASDELTDRIVERHGSESALYAQFTIGAFMRGAWFGEGIPNKQRTMLLDIVAPDPMMVRFKRTEDPEYGEYFQKGYYKRTATTTEWVNLDVPQVVYIPVHPFPGNPYGRPPVAPAIFPALFLLSVLHDLKRVVAQQGFQRIWVKILSEKVRELMALDNLDDIDDAMQDLATDFNTAWRQQKPEDGWVSPDYFDIQPIEGAINASSSTVGSADSLIGALERMLVRALKSMPIVMGAAEGVSEANANRQWEMYMASIDSFQDDLGTMIETFYTLNLNMQGIQADVEYCPQQVRASEAYRDAQTKLLNQEIAERGEDRGYVDHDQASLSVWGHKASGTVKEVETGQPDNDVPDGAGQTDGEPDSREKNWLVDQFGRRISSNSGRFSAN